MPLSLYRFESEEINILENMGKICFISTIFIGSLSSLLFVFISSPSPILLLPQGGGIYVESPISEVLPNNSLIVVLSFFARSLSFRGLSGSNKSRVGQLIGPLGNDITHSYSHPFIVSLGSRYDPGSMYVRCLRALRLGEVGIYTYRTPDEDGNDIDVNLGIYSSYTSSK